MKKNISIRRGPIQHAGLMSPSGNEVVSLEDALLGSDFGAQENPHLQFDIRGHSKTDPSDEGWITPQRKHRPKDRALMPPGLSLNKKGVSVLDCDSDSLNPPSASMRSPYNHSSLRQLSENGSPAGNLFTALPLPSSPESPFDVSQKTSANYRSVSVVLIPILSRIRKYVNASELMKNREIFGKTIGVLFLNGDFLLSVSGSEGNPLTDQLQDVFNQVYLELKDDEGFCDKLSRIKLDTISIKSSNPIPPIRTKSPSKSSKISTDDPKTPPRKPFGGATKKASNNAVDFFFKQLTTLWESGELEHLKETFSAHISVIEERLFTDENLSGTRRRLLEAFSNEFHTQIRKNPEAFYRNQTRSHPLLAAFLDRQFCVENDLWESTIKELINYAKIIPKSRQRDSEFKYGVYVFPLFPDQSDPRTHGNSVKIRAACARCSIVSQGFEPFLLAVNSGAIPRELLSGLDTTPSRKT